MAAVISKGGATAPTPTVSALGLGIGAAAFALFSLMDALIKWLSASYPVNEMVFFNALFSLVPVTLWTWRRGGFANLHTRRLHLHVLRGLVGMTAAFLAFTAFSLMPLTDAYAIIFTTPLLITALSVPVLGERVGWRRWSAIAVGFTGVLIMLRPGFQEVGPGALAAFGAACASACAVLLMRRLGTTESTGSIALYSNLTVVAVMGALLPVNAVLPSPGDLLLMAAAGLLGGTALICLIGAYRRAPTALVAPFQYSQMVWAALIGLLVFGDVPHPAVVVGALVVAGSGLFVLYRETALGRRPTAALHVGATAAQGPASSAAAGEPEPSARSPWDVRMPDPGRPAASFERAPVAAE